MPEFRHMQARPTSGASGSRRVGAFGYRMENSVPGAWNRQ